MAKSNKFEDSMFFYAVPAPKRKVEKRARKKLYPGEKKYYVTTYEDWEEFDSIVEARKFAYKCVDNGKPMAFIKLIGNDKIVGLVTHESYPNWTIVYKDRVNKAIYKLSKSGAISKGMVFKRR